MIQYVKMGFLSMKQEVSQGTPRRKLCLFIPISPCMGFVFLCKWDLYFSLCGICISPYMGFLFLSMWDLYFSLCGICISHFPIEFLHLGIIWAQARLLPPCLFLALQIRLIGGATFYKAPKTPNNLLSCIYNTRYRKYKYKYKSD